MLSSEAPEPGCKLARASGPKMSWYRTRHREKAERSGARSGAQSLMKRAEPTRNKLDLILQEIRDSRVFMDQKLGAINSNLNLLTDDQHKLAERVKSMELALVTLQPAHRA
ncbi:hypothetical protein NDU88_004074 [Pleurodeles waltl]|uniref:Uncharacterized protein n=1 Tax=Pleurodeles waltl TaxID=8319 RepID=A0AAV7T844_PLEWA|nr:hypothetical protein NDU88_004074 [Pleurodeles waltl]